MCPIPSIRRLVGFMTFVTGEKDTHISLHTQTMVSSVRVHYYRLYLHPEMAPELRNTMMSALTYFCKVRVAKRVDLVGFLLYIYAVTDDRDRGARTAKCPISESDPHRFEYPSTDRFLLM